MKPYFFKWRNYHIYDFVLNKITHYGCVEHPELIDTEIIGIKWKIKQAERIDTPTSGYKPDEVATVPEKRKEKFDKIVGKTFTEKDLLKPEPGFETRLSVEDAYNDLCDLFGIERIPFKTRRDLGTYDFMPYDYEVLDYAGNARPNGKRYIPAKSHNATTRMRADAAYTEDELKYIFEQMEYVASYEQFAWGKPRSVYGEHAYCCTGCNRRFMPETTTGDFWLKQGTLYSEYDYEARSLQKEFEFRKKGACPFCGTEYWARYIPDDKPKKIQAKYFDDFKDIKNDLESDFFESDDDVNSIF